MRRLSVLLALLLCAALPAFAQQATGQQAIEKQMTPEQFKASGLEKLSPEELANLNAWLNRTLDTETTKAAVQAEQKVKDENRGFFNFGSSEPIVSKMTGEFRGFAQGRQYTLENGQVWRQTDSATLAGVRVNNPGVKITPSVIGNAWYLQIQDYNTRAKVERLK